VGSISLCCEWHNESLPWILSLIAINEIQTTYKIDFMWQTIKILPKYPEKYCLFFWQCRPEKPTRPLTLNKDKLWCGLNKLKK
jgi:hypothetical protein